MVHGTQTRSHNLKMETKQLELKVNKNLLNSKFDGYKLCLKEHNITCNQLKKPVKKIIPNCSQYSFLYVKLLGLQNLLFYDEFSNEDNFYIINVAFSISKLRYNFDTEELDEFQNLWSIPEKKCNNKYNVDLMFVSENLAVLSDGLGTLYVLDTGNRNNNDTWNLLYQTEVLDKQIFTLKDVFFNNNLLEPRLEVLLYSIKQEESKMCSMIYLLAIKKEENIWKTVSEKHLKATGDVSYMIFEKSSEAIYTISENGCRFIYDSVKPVLSIANNETSSKSKWTQNDQYIILQFTLNENCDKSQISVEVTDENLKIKYGHDTLILGKLMYKVDSKLTKWDLNQNLLYVLLHKNAYGQLWSKVIEGDSNIIEENLVDEKLIDSLQIFSIANNPKDEPLSGITYNSEKVEEIDFCDDKKYIFQRLCLNTHSVTHTCNLGSGSVLLTSLFSNNDMPLFGIRHDVDICLWEPKTMENTDLFLNHVDTLLAMGYILASKQQKKYTVCPKDLSYVAVCESNRHLFLYAQRNLSSEVLLKNRKSGARVETVAEQRVINVGNEEVVGIHASPSCIHILTENSLKRINL